MIRIGSLHPTEGIPVTPDTIISKKLTAASIEAFDLPAGTQLARVTFASTDVANVAFVNWGSTKATVPTTAFPAAGGISTRGTTEFNIPVGSQPKFFQVSTADTTGFSIVSPSSGFLCFETWRK